MPTTIYTQDLEGCDSIRTVVDIPSHNMLAFFSANEIGNTVKIIKNDFSRKEVRTFEGQGLARLFEDVLCYMDNSGTLCTMRAATGVFLGSYKFPTACDDCCILKLSEGELAVDNGSNSITILRHNRGRDFSDIGQCKVTAGQHGHWASHGEHLVISRTNSNVQVWNYLTGKLVHICESTHGGNAVAMHGECIVVGNDNYGPCQVYKNWCDSPKHIDMKHNNGIAGITFVAPNRVMMASWDRFSFLSLVDGITTAEYNSFARWNHLRLFQYWFRSI